MALPILDGNQSPTTLSTIIVSNAHVPAHTVTSLGTQAITDIATAVSGVELGPNTLNALENITVTMGQVTITGGLTDSQLRASPVTIGGSVTATISGTPSITFGTAVITGSTSILNFPATQTVTFTQIATHGVTIDAGTAQIGSVTATISGTVPVSGTFYQATQPVSIASLPSLAAGTAQIGSVTATISGTPSVTGSVSVLNFPFTQTIAGTVTANGGNFTAQSGDSNPTKAVQIGFTELNGSGDFVSVDNDSRPFPVKVWSGTVTANVLGYSNNESSYQPIPVVPWDEGVNSGRSVVVKVQQEGVGSIPISGTVTANVFGIIDYGDNTYQQAQINLAGHEATFGNGVRLGVSIITNDGGEYGSANFPFRVAGTVTVGNSVTISSLPVQLSTTTIGGTARLNVTLSSATTVGATAPSFANLYGGSDGTNLRAISVDSSGRTVVTGTVGVSGTVPVSGTFYQATQPVSLASLPSLAAGTSQIGSVTASISGTPTVTMGAISGTVTASVSALPSGALTTRFGSVTTANTSQITTSVTNNSRKYLLAQNISSGTVTIGIGFSPTTTQGIQLIAGAGICFDSFCPTGAVYWLGATTGATWTILEG